MKEISSDLIFAIWNADNELKGTREHLKYRMEKEEKNEKGRWVFMGWAVPKPTEEKAEYKKVKENEYIMIGNTRYTLRESVKNLLF